MAAYSPPIWPGTRQSVLLSCPCSSQAAISLKTNFEPNWIRRGWSATVIRPAAGVPTAQQPGSRSRARPASATPSRKFPNEAGYPGNSPVQAGAATIPPELVWRRPTRAPFKQGFVRVFYSMGPPKRAQQRQTRAVAFLHLDRQRIVVRAEAVLKKGNIGKARPDRPVLPTDRGMRRLGLVDVEFRQ
jgi:hypothetical protein